MPRKYKPRSAVARGRPSRRDARNMTMGPCPARGKHAEDCICHGTGQVPVVNGR